MSEARHIESSGAAVVTILSNGSQLPQSVQVLSIQVHTQFNRISTATIAMADGEAAAEDFALSSGELFEPGAEIEIQLGYAASDPVTVFRGVLVKQKLKAKKQGSVLQVECKHSVFKSAYSEKFAVFKEATDADVIEQILTTYGLSSAIETTTITHQNMVQYRSTDWDFMVARAEANGHVVVALPDEVKSLIPQVGTPAMSLQYGATVIHFEAELDGREQEEMLTVRSWDYANGEAIISEAEAGDLSTVGNMSSTDLAKKLENNIEFTHATAMHTQQESDTHAQAEQNRRRFSKLKGTVACQGTTNIEPGGTLELAGFGDRFNGSVLVSGVSHSFQKGTWQTIFQLGMLAQNHLEKFKPLPKSSYNLPRVQGLEIGIVTSLEDPNQEFRVELKLPVFENEEGVWARVSQVDAGSRDRSVYWRPEVGDEVIVGFINDDPRAPVILGSLHSSNHPAPFEQTDENHKKGIVTREGLSVLFDDETKELSVNTPEGNSLVVSDDRQTVQLKDQHGNEIEMSADGIRLESAKDIHLKATGDITIEGTNTTLNAQAQLKAEGSAGAELSSGGTTVVKGLLVQIN